MLCCFKVLAVWRMFLNCQDEIFLRRNTFSWGLEKYTQFKKVTLSIYKNAVTIQGERLELWSKVYFNHFNRIRIRAKVSFKLPGNTISHGPKSW